MVVLIDEDKRLRLIVPDWVVDLESFRRWLDAADLPENARLSYLQGEVWIDISREQIFSHGLVKTQFTHLVGLARSGQLGIYLTDGARFSNAEANLSVKPDGLFVSFASLQSKKVKLVEGVEDGFVELEGSPDMVLEVVSDGSVQKDTVILREAYWEAGVQEYWLVDARKTPLSFDILRHTDRGCLATRRQKGWLKSAVFGKSFCLTQETDTLGHPTYTLAVR